MLKLLRHIDRDQFGVSVAYIQGPGTLAKEFQDSGIRVFDLTKNGHFSLFTPIRLLTLLRRNGIDILHTHLVHAALLGRIIGSIAGTKIIMSTRHFGYDTKQLSLLYRLERKTAFMDKTITTVSGAVRSHRSQKTRNYATRFRSYPTGPKSLISGGPLQPKTREE